MLNSTSEILFPPFAAMFSTTFLDFPNLVALSLAKKESPNKRVAGLGLGVEVLLTIDDEFANTAVEQGSSLEQSDSGLNFLKDKLNLICSSQSAVLPGSTLCWRNSV